MAAPAMTRVVGRERFHKLADRLVANWSSRSPLRLVVWITAALSALAALTVLLTFASLHTVIGNSDGATVVLEGFAMAHGHVLLHGWALSLDSFWLVDALFYVVAIALFGLRAGLLNVVPALIAALVVGVAMWMARGSSRGKGGLVGPLVVFALIGLPTPAFSYLFLQGPLHVGTLLWCLLAFAALQSGRFGWRFAIAVVLCAFGILGDFQMVALGIAPIVATGVLAVIRSRSWRGGAVLIAAGAAAIALAGAIRLIADALGTFTLVRANPVAHSHQVLINIRNIARYFPGTLGVGSMPISATAPAGPSWLEIAHAFGLVAVTAGVVFGAIACICGPKRVPVPGSPKMSWQLEDLLLFGFLADLATFVVLSGTGNADYARYLTAGVVFSSILAGRMMTRGVRRYGSQRAMQVLVGLGACIALSFAGGFAYNLTRPRPVQPDRALGAFLSGHHLQSGIGDYWSASITTVETGGVVTVRPVIPGPRRVLVPYGRQATSEWYEHQKFQFFVDNLARPWRAGVNINAAEASFGVPVHTYGVGTYRIYVWSHPVVLASVSS